MTILDNIVEQKQKEVSFLKQIFNPKKNNEYRGPSFLKAIESNDELKIIAEVKKASPSVGVIQSNFDPVKIARQYEIAGANAISVLTDEKFFMGANRYLQEVQKAVKLPILRKDFIIDPIQIDEALVLGAGAVLLIVTILNPNLLRKLYEYASQKNLDVLVEVHDEKELERALNIDAKIIGINNRNLKTFEVHVENTTQLLPHIPKDKVVVCESGIKDEQNIRYIADNGVHVALVGEALMREKDPAALISVWKKTFLDAYKKR